MIVSPSPASLLTGRYGLGFGIFLLGWFVWTSLDARGESVVLHLRNGDRITGSVVSEGSEIIVLNSLALGEVKVPSAEVERRERLPEPEQTAAPANAAPEIQAQLPPPPDPPPPPAEAPVPEESLYGRLFSDWKGELQVGANLAFSTKNRQTYTGRFKAARVDGPMKNMLDYSASYGRTEGSLSDNRMDGSWKIEYDLSKRFLAYNAMGAGYDQVRQIDLRYDIGPGFGYRVMTRTNLVLRVEFGGNFQEQQYENGKRQRRYSLRVAEEFWWQVTTKLRWDEKVEFFPQVDEVTEFRVRAESNLSYQFRNNLTFTLSAIDLYESSVPANVSNNDLQIRSLIGLKF